MENKRKNGDECYRPDAVEEYVCLPMSKIEVQPMTREAAEIFALMEMHSTDSSSHVFNVNKFNGTDVKEVIASRMAAYNIRTESRVKLAFILAAEQKLGALVMHMAYASWWMKNNKKEELLWEDFCFSLWPDGFPPLYKLREVWEGQKCDKPADIERSKPIEMGGHSDNLVDYLAASQTIIVPKTFEL